MGEGIEFSAAQFIELLEIPQGHVQFKPAALKSVVPDILVTIGEFKDRADPRRLWRTLHQEGGDDIAPLSIHNFHAATSSAVAAVSRTCNQDAKLIPRYARHFPRNWPSSR